MPKSPREISPKRPVILFLAVIALVTLFFSVKFFLFQTKTQDTEHYGWEEKTDSFEKSSEPPTPTLEQKRQTLNASTQGADTQAPEPTPCQRLAEELSAFFSHLEGQEYIRAYELNEPINQTLNKLIIKLLNNPPIISQETEDLFTVLKNTAHFYRILGHKDLSLIKDILSYEQNDAEHLMALFYENFLTQGDCPENTAKIQMPLSKMYEYAGFFLNTLGGQSYLFRRDSRIRLLAKYYCTLILDQATQKGLNRYNIDETYTLDSVTKEIQDADSLENQAHYLTTLTAMRKRLLNRPQ